MASSGCALKALLFPGYTRFRLQDGNRSHLKGKPENIKSVRNWEGVRSISRHRNIAPGSAWMQGGAEDRGKDVAGRAEGLITWSFCCSLLFAGRSYRRLLLSCTNFSVLLSQSWTGSALTSKSFIWIFRFYEVLDRVRIKKIVIASPKSIIWHWKPTTVWPPCSSPLFPCS